MTQPANVHFKCPSRRSRRGLYGIGTWDQEHARFTAPLDAGARQDTGCQSEYAQHPMGNMSLPTATARALELWGYVEVSNPF